MHLRTSGAGPAILLLHAFPFDGRMWRDQVEALEADYRVLVPDMPGFGESTRPDGTPSLDDWGKLVLARCKAEGVERALVAGCSMGGYLALAMHRIAPGFAAGMALVNTRASADTQDARRRRYEMVERARHEGEGFLLQTELPLSPKTIAQHPDIAAFAREMMVDATAVGVMAAQRAMASRKDARALLPTLRVPVSIVYGLDDPVIPRTEVESMATAILDAVSVPIADAGHLTPIEKPADVTAALRTIASRTYSP